MYPSGVSRGGREASASSRSRGQLVDHHDLVWSGLVWSGLVRFRQPLKPFHRVSQGSFAEPLGANPPPTIRRSRLEANGSPIHTRVEYNSNQYRRIARLGRSGEPYQPIQYGLGLQNPRLPARIVGRHSSMEL
jgi:hypothetical protein